MMKVRLILISIIVLIVLSVFIGQNVVKYVYVSPHVDASAFKYVNKTVKPIEKNLKQIMQACQKEYKDMKLTYINYYGSGFIKDNPIPNDLDISVGVDLGTYEYNGENIEEIAKNLVSKIELFHLYIIIDFTEEKSAEYLIKRPDLGQYNEIQNKKIKSINSVKSGLQNVLDNKISILHFNKDFKGKPIDYTYIFDSSEVLVNDLIPFFMYTKGLIYNNKMVDYPKEISITPAFCVKIKNTKTNEIKEVELIEEFFMGIKFQLSRRFFAPMVFTGDNSINYIKNLDYLSDDKKYIETLIFIFFDHLYRARIYFEFPVDNIKIVKRFHQCADIIYPALSEEEKTKIYSDVSSVLSNENVQLANNYMTCLKNFIYMTSNEYIYSEAKRLGYVNDLIKVMENSLEKLNEHNEKEVKILKENHKYLLSFVDALDKKDDIATQRIIKIINNNFFRVSKTTTKLVNNNIENRQKLMEDYKILKNILNKAGLHEIEIYSSDLKNFYIVKNEFTKNLTPADLKQLAKENNLPDVEYKLIDDIGDRSRGEFKIVRYNSTEAEDKYWEELQNKLLEYRKNYKIKKKYVF